MTTAFVYSILSQAARLSLIVFGFVLLAGALFHWRQKVAFVPSSNRVVRAMLELAAPKPHEKIIDLGAGDARFLIHAKKMFPDATVTGYEGAWWVYALGRVRVFFSGENVTLLHQDFFSVSLRDADVVCCYLSIDAMKRLLPKLQQELKPGARVVSHAFSFHGLEPAKTVRLPMPIGQAVLRLYTAPLTT